MSHFSEAIKLSLMRAKSFTQVNKGVMTLFCVVLIFADAVNYFLQSQVAQGVDQSRFFEMIFQLFILFYSVVLIHFISNWYHQRRLSFFKLVGESLLLSPGYLLQAILYVLTTLVSLCLLIIPGIYCGVSFYMAPILSVLYPSYSGKTFMLSYELSKGRFFNFLLVILLTVILSFIPDGLGLLLSGKLNSIYSLWLSPFGALLFVVSELIIVFFVLKLLEDQFPEDFQGDPRISS